ncbi:hypothetical protein SGUI_2759 [Serinicoccus hydrothermalis]|uniref:Uncharacterized protein n=1 Tax=Serinicoccus hydrothermalis TaxID=1758689 RepID=A0A1B1NFL3_9MICO|nr:hypothetical protein SGUI_2759 [Serinicoccus hydrothermalis]
MPPRAHSATRDRHPTGRRVWLLTARPGVACGCRANHSRRSVGGWATIRDARWGGRG